MVEFISDPERVNTTFSMNKKIRNEFYHTLIRKYGCTRSHVGESVDAAIKMWIEKNEKELDLKKADNKNVK